MTKKVSRQRRWQIQRKLEGRCIDCGKPRGALGSSNFCYRHLVARRKYGRQRLGCKPKRPGGVGRPRTEDIIGKRPGAA